MADSDASIPSERQQLEQSIANVEAEEVRLKQEIIDATAEVISKKVALEALPVVEAQGFSLGAAPFAVAPVIALASGRSILMQRANVKEAELATKAAKEAEADATQKAEEATAFGSVSSLKCSNPCLCF